jgi:hypothetical protein
MLVQDQHFCSWNLTSSDSIIITYQNHFTFFQREASSFCQNMHLHSFDINRLHLFRLLQIRTLYTKAQGVAFEEDTYFDTKHRHQQLMMEQQKK